MPIFCNYKLLQHIYDRKSSLYIFLHLILIVLIILEQSQKTNQLWRCMALRWWLQKKYQISRDKYPNIKLVKLQVLSLTI